MIGVALAIGLWIIMRTPAAEFVLLLGVLGALGAWHG